MSEEQIIDIVQSMIPQYYISKLEKVEQTVTYTLNGRSFELHASRPNKPELNKFKSYVENNIELLSSYNSPMDERNVESVEITLVNEWLRIRGFEADWFRLFEFFAHLENRTNENLSVGINLIYNKNDCGMNDFFNLDEDKIMDILGDSHYTYFKIGKGYTYLDYNCIEYIDISSPCGYSQIPRFLKPYASILSESNECGITMTRLGDIIIYDKESMLAAKRKGRWQIYAADTFKNCFVDLISNFGSKKDYRLACHIFDLVWDISYRRHGALIILKPQGAPRRINNLDSILDTTTENNIRYKLKEAIQRINLLESMKYKSIIVELSSVDGAIIFDHNGKVEAFGAIIQTHEKANNCTGARSTGALSALEHGYIPIKISSDGDITLYKKVYDENGNEEVIQLNFT